MVRSDMTTGQGGHCPGATPMHEKRFLVSFIVDDQPTTIEVNSTGDDLTPEQARAHIEAHPAVNAGRRTSASRVTPLRPPDSQPGHSYQPGSSHRSNARARCLPAAVTLPASKRYRIRPSWRLTTSFCGLPPRRSAAPACTCNAAP